MHRTFQKWHKITIMGMKIEKSYTKEELENSEWVLQTNLTYIIILAGNGKLVKIWDLSTFLICLILDAKAWFIDIANEGRGCQNHKNRRLGHLLLCRSGFHIELPESLNSQVLNYKENKLLSRLQSNSTDPNFCISWSFVSHCIKLSYGDQITLTVISFLI